jgi:anti-sigma-K factor RskA
MSDDVNRDGRDDRDDDLAVAEIEALLAELDIDDLEPASPPVEVWAGIEERIAEPAPVLSIAEHRRRRPPAMWLLAAAAAVVVVVAGAVVLVNRDTDEQVVSAAALTFDPSAFDPRGAEARARAQLLDRDGSYSIRLTDTSFPSLTDDDLELWLIEPDADGNPVDVAPVSLVDPDGDGVYEVPEGLDPSTHFVVDISIEPRDGDSAHSGQSILRGAFEDA